MAARQNDTPPQPTMQGARTVPGGRPSEPVTIRGRMFPSMAAAARHFKVSKHTIWDAWQRDRLDYVGLGSGNGRKRK